MFFANNYLWNLCHQTGVIIFKLKLGVKIQLGEFDTTCIGVLADDNAVNPQISLK